MENILTRARLPEEEPNINTVYLPPEYKLITIMTTTISMTATEHQILHP